MALALVKAIYWSSQCSYGRRARVGGMKRPMTLLMALMMTTTALFAGVTADNHEGGAGDASWGADALMFAQDHVDAYSVSNHSQPAFDLATTFNLTVASDGENVTGGLGGNWTDECDMNWPSDSYHIAVYAFVSEYVLNEGASVGCYLDNSNLSQTYQNLVYELEDGWHAHVGDVGTDDGGDMTEEEYYAFFNNTDADADGNVSSDEFEDAYCPDGCDQDMLDNISAVFTMIDADGSGGVSWEEFRVYVIGDDSGVTPGYLMALFDLDDSGDVTSQEVIDAMNDMRAEEGDDMLSGAEEDLFISLFEDADGNSDGVIDIDEIMDFWDAMNALSGPSIEELMASMDADGDGLLSYQEIIDAINAGNELDGEPPLTEEEKLGIQHTYNDSDEDGDGFLDIDEFDAFWDALGYGGSDDGPSPEMMFSLCDEDGDGFLTAQEIIDCFNAGSADEGEDPMTSEEEEMLESLFDDADADVDGFLDLQEFEDFIDSMPDDGGDGDMVCVDMDAQVIVPELDNEDDCLDAGYAWVEDDSGGGDDDGGCPFDSTSFCLDISDMCDPEGSDYDGVTCGEEIAHYCADLVDDGGYDSGCDTITDMCLHDDTYLCEAFNGFDHDVHHDSDGDTIPDDVDNCPVIMNELQGDLDGDGVGNACDDDDDNDSIEDDVDNCPLLENEEQDNLDGDGLGDACDDDIDGDGVADDVDDFPNDNCAALDSDGDGMPDYVLDGENDPVPDCQTDLNEDNDDDNDGIGDAVDCNPLQSPGDGSWEITANDDADNDGQADGCDYEPTGDFSLACPEPFVLTWMSGTNEEGGHWYCAGTDGVYMDDPAPEDCGAPGCTISDGDTTTDDAVDSDGDGLIDDLDSCPDSAAPDTDDGCQTSAHEDDDEDDEDGGGLPGFTFIMTLTAMMGALLIAGRRKA